MAKFACLRPSPPFMILPWFAIAHAICCVMGLSFGLQHPLGLLSLGVVNACSLAGTPVAYIEGLFILCD